MKQLTFIALLFLSSCYKDGLSACDSLHARMDASNNRIELAKSMAESNEISWEEATRRIELEQEAMKGYQEEMEKNGCIETDSPGAG